MTTRRYRVVFFAGVALTTVALVVSANFQASGGHLGSAYFTGAIAFVVGMAGAIRGAQVDRPSTAIRVFYATNEKGTFREPPH
jgi:hypothetical protein